MNTNYFTGLKGMHGTRLKPHQGREHRHKRNLAAKQAWDPEREDRRSYLTLDTRKIKLAKPKSKSKSKKGKK